MYEILTKKMQTFLVKAHARNRPKNSPPQGGVLPDAGTLAEERPKALHLQRLMNIKQSTA
jgi:hypothetical protein